MSPLAVFAVAAPAAALIVIVVYLLKAGLQPDRHPMIGGQLDRSDCG